MWEQDNDIKSFVVNRTTILGRAFAFAEKNAPTSQPRVKRIRSCDDRQDAILEVRGQVQPPSHKRSTIEEFAGETGTARTRLTAFGAPTKFAARSESFTGTVRVSHYIARMTLKNLVRGISGRLRGLGRCTARGARRGPTGTLGQPLYSTVTGRS